MPPFPGVADRANCRDWEPGHPGRPGADPGQGRAYWDAYRGTPKAFVTLRAGQAMWNNRFGNLTAVRYPPRPGRPAMRWRDGGLHPAGARTPPRLGLFFRPVREQALAAGSQAMDFGQLFLGFSLFLIVAALLLTALLFSLAVEQRAEEVGILLALGFPPRAVRRLFLVEGAASRCWPAWSGAAARDALHPGRGPRPRHRLERRRRRLRAAVPRRAGDPRRRRRRRVSSPRCSRSGWSRASRPAPQPASCSLAGSRRAATRPRGGRRAGAASGSAGRGAAASCRLAFLAALALVAAGAGGRPRAGRGRLLRRGRAAADRRLAACRLLLDRLDADGGRRPG